VSESGRVIYYVVQIRYSMSVSESTDQYTRKSPTRSTVSSHLESAPVFVLCEGCYWSATFLDKYRVRKGEVNDDDTKCPHCDANGSLSSLPIMTNESFTFNYTVKRGIELEFKKRTL